jgi:hypothetical protein
VRSSAARTGSSSAATTGGEINATVVSVLASCSLHKIEPFAYMRDLLCLLPRWPSHRVLELAPAYWRETLEKRETQETLDANVLRRVVLGLPGAASHRPPDLPRQHAAVCDGVGPNGYFFFPRKKVEPVSAGAGLDGSWRGLYITD